MAGLNGSSNILAQCVPALARASQLLCTVSQPDQARDALRQAAALLDGNGRFAEIAAVKELTDRCRVTAQTGTERELVAACRQLGATVARQMTVLTQEIQQQAKVPAKPAAPAPGAPSARLVEPIMPTVPSKPLEAAEPAEKAGPVEKPRPVAPPKPVAPVRPAPVEKPRPVEEPVTVPAAKVPEEKRPVEKVRPAPRPSVVPGLVERITVARTAAEKAAVTLALQDGKRFAVVGNGTIIDTKTNRMWAACPGPITLYSGAESYTQNLRLANYADWRLPAPEELQGLVAEGGIGLARSLGMFSPEPGGGGEWLWSSRWRRRFWIFGREAICISLRTGQLSPQKAGAGGVAPMAVRSAG